MSGVETKEKGMNKRRDERENLKKKEAHRWFVHKGRRRGRGFWCVRA